MIFIYTLLGILTAIILLFLVLMVIPLPYQLGLYLNGWQLRVHCQTLGLVSFIYETYNQQPILLIAGRTIPLRQKTDPDISQRNGGRKSSPTEFLSVMSRVNRPLIQQIWLAVKSAVTHILPKSIILQGRIGLEDPCDTGLLFLLLQFLEKIPHSKVNLKPVWDAQEQYIELQAKGRLIVSVLLFYAARFFFSAPMRELRRKKKSRPGFTMQPSAQ
jgi:hypothetical protein